MGSKNCRGVVNADYKLTYVEDGLHKTPNHTRKPCNVKGKKVKVLIDHNIVEHIPIESNDLTVGWLLSEVTRRYNVHYNKKVKEGKGDAEPKKLIVGLKSVIFFPTLDYYLTKLDNVLSPIKHNTKLAVHFAKVKKTVEKVTKGKLNPIGSSAF